MENAIELRGLTKQFGSVVANSKVDLDIRHGEILSILGENGSGKTSLMNMISGIYYPDEGHIFIEGKEVSIRSPKDAYALGIGMIHQHFKLIDVLTAAENIVLGLPGEARLNMKDVAYKIHELTSRYGFQLEPSMKIYDMSVSQKQTVEIVKMLYRGAKILILDEPTAVLTPQETKRLFDILRNMRADGRAIVIITHKLNEVLELSDRVAVLRKGENVGTVDTKDATVQSLTELMVGQKVTLDIERGEPINRTKRIEMKDVSCVNIEDTITLNHASFTVYSGEILGIAGIAGSGQREVLESIAGLLATTSGSIRYFPPDGKEVELTGMHPNDIRKMGVRLAFVPEDRLGMGLVGSMDLTNNVMLRSYRNGATVFTDRKRPRTTAEKLISQLEISTPAVTTPVRRLSGGNVQKVLVGREIATNPTVLMVAYPVRGLDIHSSYIIYNLLNAQKRSGTAILCVGEDLDVLLALCDRVLVLSGGKVTGIVDARKINTEQVGALMLQEAEGVEKGD